MHEIVDLAGVFSVVLILGCPQFGYGADALNVDLMQVAVRPLPEALMQRRRQDLFVDIARKLSNLHACPQN